MEWSQLVERKSFKLAPQDFFPPPPPSLETLYSSGIDEASLQLKERKEITLQATTTPNETKPVIDIERFSNYLHLLRVTAWVFRVVTRSHLFSATPLSVTEWFRAKPWLFKTSTS